MGHKNVPNIVSLSHCLLHFNSYLCKGNEEMHATMLKRRSCTILEEDVIFLFTSCRRVC